MISGKNLLERAGHALMMVSAWPGRASSWLVLIVIAAVLTAVIGSLMRLNELIDWGFTIPVLGQRMTITGLAELQWHLFAVMVMFGGAYTLAEDRHVRVDFIYANIGERGRALVDLLGDICFLLPFCAIIAWLSQSFVGLAFRSGEQSDYGGLIDRYVIKAVLPAGLLVLFAAGLGRVLANIGFLIRSKGDPSATRDGVNQGTGNSGGAIHG